MLLKELRLPVMADFQGTLNCLGRVDMVGVVGSNPIAPTNLIHWLYQHRESIFERWSTRICKSFAGTINKNAAQQIQRAATEVQSQASLLQNKPRYSQPRVR